MAELFRNAWQLGWLRFTASGKLPAVLLAALLFLFLGGGWKRQKAFFWYTALSALFCIVPVTAIFLMLYQTRFYDYEWIWSMVPMTAAAAWGATQLLEPEREDAPLSGMRKRLPLALLLLAALALCGGPWRSGVDRKAERDKRQKAEKVLSLIAESGDEDICLWAPREILEYARQGASPLRLLYGRNMWEEALGAYSYDVYPAQMEELYLWMENVQQTEDVAQDGEGRLADGPDCLRAAVRAGADHILLPGRLDAETVEDLAAPLGFGVARLDDYYLLRK